MYVPRLAKAIAFIISIHAPRGGSDRRSGRRSQGTSRRDFNPRSPWGERLSRARDAVNYRCTKTFQSTLPVGGATCPGRASPAYISFVDISIHAPRGGSDSDRHGHHKLAGYGISIHAPRGGSDRARRLDKGYRGYFNPRSPWGERRHRRARLWAARNFNPRSPWGERRQICRRSDDRQPISIHAPRGGSDRAGRCPRRSGRDFNPRSPWGERPARGRRGWARRNFNPRSPWGERLLLVGHQPRPT